MFNKKLSWKKYSVQYGSQLLFVIVNMDSILKWHFLKSDDDDDLVDVNLLRPF